MTIFRRAPVVHPPRIAKADRPRISQVVAAAATLLIATVGCGAPAEITANLGGAQEVPPVTTMATGTGQFRVSDDTTISGNVKTSGLKGVAAHIHEGAPGINGGVVVALTMNGDNAWTVPAGTKLTAAQMDALKAGNLYVNVHSEAHKDGEIRGQLTK